VADNAHPFASTIIDLSMPVDVEHVLSLFEYRTMLETYTARLAAERATPRDLRQLQEAVTLTVRAAEQGDHPLFGTADRAFHAGLAKATRNPFLVTSVDTVYMALRQAVGIATATKVALSSITVAAEQHTIIFAAIKDGRPEAAATAIEQHVHTTATTFQQAVRQHMARLMSNGANAWDPSPDEANRHAWADTPAPRE
jgi:DNA-binding GntR family transcriptional regulator